MMKRNYTLAFLVLVFSLLTTVSRAGTNQQPISDTVITAKIMTMYTKDPLLSPFKINVATNNGVVNVWGLVETDTQLERAVVIAEATRGVSTVNATALRVKNSKRPLSDTLITAQIKGLLLKNKLVKGSGARFLPIHVETKDGVVYLSGQLASTAQIKNALQLANSVDGVKSVKNGLTISNI